jgi:hypothetical protein
VVAGEDAEELVEGAVQFRVCTCGQVGSVIALRRLRSSAGRSRLSPPTMTI